LLFRTTFANSSIISVVSPEDTRREAQTLTQVTDTFHSKKYITIGWMQLRPLTKICYDKILLLMKILVNWLIQFRKYCELSPVVLLFLLAIVLSVLLWYTDSDYPFGIFKLFLKAKFTHMMAFFSFQRWIVLHNQWQIHMWYFIPENVNV